MTNAIVKIKIMPSSPDTNLEKIQEDAESLLRKNDADNMKFEKQPIAFGLNALFVMFAWPEEKELEDIEKKLKNVENVNSVETVDIRRAIG